MNKNNHHCQFDNLKKNMQNIYGEEGLQWISNLPSLVDELAVLWKLRDIKPVNNMTFHFVAKAKSEINTPVVLKIGIDKSTIENEMQALKIFNGQSAVKFIDYCNKYNAMLLQQAVPGSSLKSIYPKQCQFVMNEYVKTVNLLHKPILPTNHSFPHVSEWLASIDKVKSNLIPINILEKALSLKNYLLKTSKNEFLLHGDLHHDNVLQNENEWIVIDPKGIIGEKEFEYAAFDFIHITELHKFDLQDVFQKRIKLLSDKANLDFQRLSNWIFVRFILSAAWSIEDKDDPNRAIHLARTLLAESLHK